MNNMLKHRTHLIKTLGVAGLLVGSLSLSGCGEGEDRQASYLERAKTHFAAENFEKAEVDARNVLQINPKNNDARVMLADIAFNKGEIRKAYGNYLAVLEEDPNHIAALIGISKIYVAVRDFEKALEHTDRVLVLDATNSEAKGFKALALAGLKREDEAYQLATTVLETDVGNVAAIGVVIQYFSKLEKYQEALAILDQGQAASPSDARLSLMKVGILEALKDNDALEKELLVLTQQSPDSVQYSNALVRFYIRESQKQKAQQAVFDFAENNPESYDAKRRVIQFLLQQDSQAAAIAQAEKYLASDDGDTRLINTLAEVHLFTGDKEKGMETLNRSIATDPESVGAIEARTRLFQLYSQAGETQKAKDLIADILKIESENEMALMGRVGFNLQERQFKDAVIDLRTVVKNNPSNKVAIKTLAQVQELNGSPDLAMENYKKLLGLGQVDIEVVGSAARLAIQTEQYNEAERYIRYALELEDQSDNPQLVTDLVKLLALKEDWAAAQEFAQRLVDSEKSRALGYYLQGGIQQQLQDEGKALASFKQSLAEQPKALETMAAISSLMTKQEGKSKTVGFFQQHCKANQTAPCFYVLGSVQAQANDFKSAKKSLKQSIALQNKFLRSYQQLAKVYAREKDFDQYVATMQQGIANTKSNGLRFDLATYYYSTQNYQAAADMYQTIIELNPNAALAAKNNLAMIYAENIPSEANMKQAKALAADLQESDNAAYLDTVGWVSYLSGDYETAITYIKAAVDQLGTAAVLQYHLGMAYYKAGDLVKAKEHLTLATAEEAKYFGYEEAKQTLESL